MTKQKNLQLSKVLTPCFLVLTPLIGQAAQLAVKGQVEFVRTHDAVLQPSWAPPIFWFTLKGVTSAGNCQGRFNNGSILFVARDTTELALVLAANAKSYEIEVSLDDTNGVNGYCVASYITIGNPAPSN